MSKPGYTVRRMTRSELDMALTWARDEGWNPGLHDADSFYAADPNGFFLGELNGEPVGCISAVAYDDTYGFMGFYMVRAPFRHQGYGLPLWDAAIDYMGSRTIGADGVPAMLAKYETMGFRIAYRNIRYGGEGGGEWHQSDGLVAFEEVSWRDLAAYDRAHVPADRTAYLRHWVHQPEAVVRVAVEGGRIVGYGMIRACKGAWKCGPLFADTPGIAQQLFDSLRGQAAGPLFLDVPEPNQASVAMAEQAGMTPVFETSRIYKGPPPHLPIETIFGVTSFELG